MMRNTTTNRRRWLFILLSTVATVCFCMAIYQYQHFAALSDCVNVRYLQPSLTIEAVQQALQNEHEHKGDVVDATLWSESKAQAVTGEQERIELLRVLFVYGDASRAYNSPFLSGTYPAIGDEIGCAVDQKAADVLFGGKNVLGNTLSVQGKSYIVRGVFEGLQGVVIVQADDEDESKFGAISLAVLPNVNGRETAQTFLLSNGLMMPTAVIDAPFLVQFARALALLPAWIIALVLVARMILRTIRLRTFPLHFLAYAAVTMGGAVLMFYAAQFFFVVPDRLIPTMWADFSFWSRIIEQMRSYAEQARTVELLLSDRIRNNAIALCGTFSCCAAMLYLGAMSVKVTFSIRQWLVVELWTIVATFMTLLLFSSMGLLVDAPRALWLTWALYIAIASILNLEHHSLKSAEQKQAFL